MRVIVIGSGIAGLTAAIGLRKVGIDCTVYERAPELREVGAGISLWANALRALDHIDAGDTVRAVSLPLVRSELRAKEGRQVLASFAAVDFEKRVGVRPVVAMAHRAELVGALAGLIPADAVQFGHECVGIEPHDDRVTVRFANGRTDEADCVVGADGIKSFVRSTLFGHQPPRYAGYTCWRGIAPRPTGIEPGYVGEWWGRGQRFGITTLTQNRVYWFAVRNAPAGRHSADEKMAVVELFRSWATPVPELIGATPSERLIHGDILDRPPTRLWSVGRVGLIGDAAHPTTPNLGQGGCMAIEDGVALARALMTHHNPLLALAAFTKERSPRTAAVTNESWRLGRVGQWGGRISCRLRDRALGMLLPRIGHRSFLKYATFDTGPLMPLSESVL